MVISLNGNQNTASDLLARAYQQNDKLLPKSQGEDNNAKASQVDSTKPVLTIVSNNQIASVSTGANEEAALPGNIATRQQAAGIAKSLSQTINSNALAALTAQAGNIPRELPSLI